MIEESKYMVRDVYTSASVLDPSGLVKLFKVSLSYHLSSFF